MLFRSASLGYENFGSYSTYEDDSVGLQGRICPNGRDGNPVGGQAAPNEAVSGLWNWISPNAWQANRVQNGDLAYPGLIVGGDAHVRSQGGGQEITAVMDVTTPSLFDNYTDAGVFQTAIGKSGTTLYTSFLFQVGGDVTTFASSQAIMLFQEKNAATTYSNRFEIGQSWGNTNLRAQGTVLEPVNNDVHLMVMKIVYGGTMLDATDQVSMWFDPDPSASEASLAATATYTRNMTFTHIQLKGDRKSVV